jgi:cardiolipin synthase
MDIRSFSLNMEVSVLVHGADFVRRMRTVQDGYRANSRKLELADWLDRPAGAKAFDNLARLTSSLQ